MPENTYTIKVETAAAEKNVQVLLDKVNELVAALGKLAQATSGGILSNPEAVGSMQAISQAQGGGAPSGIGGGSHAGATVGAARAQATGPQSPTVAPTGFPSGTTNPAPPVSNIGTSPGGGTAPSGIVPPSGRQTGAAPGTRSGPSYSGLQDAVTAAQSAFDANPTDDNRFALLQAQDRLSRANRRLNPPKPAGFDWTSSAFARTGAGFIIGQSAVSYASGWFDIASREQLRGGVEWQERGRQAGMGWGAALGGGLGFLAGGPVGALIGGTLISQLGGSIGAWANAGKQAQDDTFAALSPTSQVIGSPGYGKFSGMAGWFKQFGSSSQRPSAATLGGIWSQFGEGLFGAGINPWQGTRGGFDRIGMVPIDGSGSTSGLIRGAAGLAHNTAASIMNLPDTLASQLTRIIGIQYGTEASKQIGREQAAIIGATPETGGNIADMMVRFGPMATARNRKMWGAIGASSIHGIENAAPDVNPWVLSNASAASREAQREARIGATLQRGSGAAVFGAIGREMEAYAALPGGRDSEAYTSAHARRREARMAAYAQQDIEAYGIPATRLATQRGVLDALPYAPGYRFGVELQSIALNRRQAGVIQTRLQRGDLTEQQQLQLEQELSGLRVASARSVAALTEGVADRLPALSAGRPTRFSRLDATQLAALNLGRMGHPGREFGAVNGAQLAAQDAFVNQMLGPGGERMIAPMGRDLPVGTERVEALLERIAQILQQNGGAGAGPRTRVGEAVNKGQAVANGNPAPSYGNGGYN